MGRGGGRGRGGGFTPQRDQGPPETVVGTDVYASINHVSNLVLSCASF